jgi:phosphoserine aminotransferase
MTYAKISAAQAMSINLARAHASDADRKTMKKEIFTDARRAYGIPDDHKIVVETDSNSTNYCVIKNRETRQPYPLGDDGRWSSAASEHAEAIEWLWVQVAQDEAVTALRDHVMVQDEYPAVMRHAPNGTSFGDNLVTSFAGQVWVRMDRDDLDTDHLADEHDL